MIVQRSQVAEVRVPRGCSSLAPPSDLELPTATTTTTTTELVPTTETRKRKMKNTPFGSSNLQKGNKMSRAFRWHPIHCYCCAAILLVILLLSNSNTGIQCAGRELDWQAGGLEQNDETKTSSSSSQSRDPQMDDRTMTSRSVAEPKGAPSPQSAEQFAAHHYEANAKLGDQTSKAQRGGAHLRFRRSPLLVAPSVPASLLMPINELRVSGSKNEPPSRPSVDWSKQRPYFGPDMVRNVSVELGKTAYLTCKVFELGDKTVSWLRPRENEILTSGRFTYIGDSRFASINDKGSHDWILEIKDVGLNDSTSYECQVSTDPKMSAIINLQVKAAKAKIKQGEQFYAPLGSNIEFTCEIGQKAPAYPQSLSLSLASNVQQTYWYYNGNLLNYAKTAHNSLDKNFSIEWDSMTQTSRFRIFNIQLNDAGNYTCKPTSAEPATIRLHVKRFNKSSLKDRTHYGNGYHSANTKEAQRNRQYFSLENGSGLEIVSDSGVGSKTLSLAASLTHLIVSCFVTLMLLNRCR